jgi:hypothetical protein
MNNFSNYIQLGYEHIVNVDSLDHILFILVLVAAYQTRAWLKMLIAVSFFTLGHSVTLTLSALDAVNVDKGLIEFLIPLSILITALFNLTKAGQDQKNRSKYWIAGLFGLIHGFGFSSAYEMLVLGDGNYWSALLPFNLGVELGQLVIVLAALFLMLIFQQILNKKHRDWNLFVSGAGFGLALVMCIENWSF